MNFDAIEGLTEEQLFQLYDGVIEGDFLAGYAWTVKCTNGKSGSVYYPGRGGDELGLFVYKQSTNPNHATYQICGNGQYGYGVLVAQGVNDLSDPGAFYLLWDIKCSNGTHTQVFDESTSPIEYTIGQSTYGPGNASTWWKAMYRACGDGIWGYAVAVANNYYNRR